MRKIVVLGLFLPLVILPSCKIHESFSRADLIGFSADVQPSYHVEEGPFKNLEPQSAPYDLLANEEGFGELLEDVRTGDNTTLYYATDLAIDRIKYVRTKVAKRDPETLYYIFIISDGLDNASVSASHNHRQTTFISRPEQYRKRIARRLKNVMGVGKDWNMLTVYPMVLRGEDLERVRKDNKMSEKDFDEYLSEQFDCLRYSSDGEAPKVNISTDFDDIYTELEDDFRHSKYEFRVSKDFVGKLIRMTLTSSNGDEAKVEGVLKRCGINKYKLDNLTLTNLTSRFTDTRYCNKKGTYLKSVGMDGKMSNVYFRLRDLRLPQSKAFFNPVDAVQSYQNGRVWQTNTEYTRQASIHPNTYCIFLLDASTSMGKDLEAAKEHIKRVVSMINAPF